jgi:hypothetical protein
MLGALMAFGSILTLGVVVGFVVLVVSEILGVSSDAEGEGSSLVGISLTALLAFFLGGFVAGRMASRSGLKHGGLLVALLTLVAAMFLAVVGVILGSGLVNGLTGVRLPSTLEDVHSLGVIMLVIGVLALILPYFGGAMGGVRGTKTGRRRSPLQGEENWDRQSIRRVKREFLPVRRETVKVSLEDAYRIRRIYRKLAKMRGRGHLRRFTVFVRHENVVRLLEFLGYRQEE